MKPSKTLILLTATAMVALGSSGAIAKSTGIIAPNNKSVFERPSYTPIPKVSRPAFNASKARTRGFIECIPGSYCPGPIIRLPPPWGPPIGK